IDMKEARQISSAMTSHFVGDELIRAIEIQVRQFHAHRSANTCVIDSPALLIEDRDSSFDVPRGQHENPFASDGQFPRSTYTCKREITDLTAPWPDGITGRLDRRERCKLSRAEETQEYHVSHGHLSHSKEHHLCAVPDGHLRPPRSISSHAGPDGKARIPEEDVPVWRLSTVEYT